MIMNRTVARIGLIHLLAEIVFVFLISTGAKSQEVFSAKLINSGKVEVEISEPFSPLNNVGGPVIHLFEIIGSGPGKTKTFERTPLNIMKSVSAQNHFIADLDIAPPSDKFDHYEVEVANYKTAAGTETFRGGVYGLKAEIVKASGRRLVLRFRGLNTTDWEKLRLWIAAASAAGPDVNVTLANGTTSALKVTGADSIGLAPLCPPLKLGERFVECSLRATLTLDGSLPIGQPGKVTLTFPASVFTRVVADALPLELVKAGVGTGEVDTAALANSQDRDPIRTNVIEAGGSYNTSIKLDPDPTTNKKPERETKASLDLRVATKTITFADSGSQWSSWTPAQFDAQISTGKITGDSLSTNTMRLFTQVERVYSATRKQGIDFFRIVGEGGAAADRDLRVIEYTGSADFRYNPAILNRVLQRNPPPDLGNRIKVELMPFGFELGHRQVRRDPLFLSDDFIRRFRFAAKLELELPPYFQFSIENRTWWRGEVDRDHFRNYFTTSFTIIPLKISSNSSLSVILSYDRGSLPPFSTPRESAFKVGFRIRRKQW